MLTFIFPELFNESRLETGDPNINTSQLWTSDTILKKVFEEDGDTYNLVPKNIPLFKITSDDIEYNKHNMIINNIVDDNKRVRPIIKSSNLNETDTEFIALAIPFNGSIIPLEETEKYKIHKGVLLISDTYSVSLKDGNHKYKKILYLLIEIVNKEEDLTIDFISHSQRRNKNKDGLTDKWNENIISMVYTEETINIKSSHKMVNTWDDERYKGVPIFVTCQPKTFISKPVNEKVIHRADTVNDVLGGQ